ncbi:MAG: hypothetical protein DPW09_33285 [Anaerolineae bacterium]|nr:hypothetical protein [Anaerolineales bacterium]MCQ3978326.1 hypothetical protein [Anaerolineae bacterium]
MARQPYKPIATLAQLQAAERDLKALPNWQEIGDLMRKHNQVGYKAMAYLLQGKTAEELKAGE